MLTAGSVRLVRQTNGQRRFLLLRVCPGELCVVSACSILGDAAYPVSGVAEQDLRGATIPPALFTRFMEQSAAFQAFVFQRFAECLAKLVRLLDDLASRKLDERLASLLLTKTYPIRLTHQMLADELGSTREVVSRLLGQLEARGLVKLGRGLIYIPDEHALRQFGRGVRDG